VSFVEVEPSWAVSVATICDHFFRLLVVEMQQALHKLSLFSSRFPQLDLNAQSFPHTSLTAL
jgi:hypothetical protein